MAVERRDRALHRLQGHPPRPQPRHLRGDRGGRGRAQRSAHRLGPQQPGGRRGRLHRRAQRAVDQLRLPQGRDAPAGLAFDLAAPEVHAALLAPATQDAQTKRVIPDLPGQSYLFKKLTRTTQTTGEQMPKGKAPLDAEKVQILFRWIFNGAPA
ncbi:hypothetical protein [Nannocystis pusilla]|uniref:hypothetical protein n=1 Tax=Nannocystis pusilla TaxID=889268 RepID=UPI003B78A814